MATVMLSLLHFFKHFFQMSICLVLIPKHIRFLVSGEKNASRRIGVDVICMLLAYKRIFVKDFPNCLYCVFVYVCVRNFTHVEHCLLHNNHILTRIVNAPRLIWHIVSDNTGKACSTSAEK